MDWLSKHRAIIECDKKMVALKCFNQSEVTIHGIRFGPLSNVISAMQARQFLKGDMRPF